MKFFKSGFLSPQFESDRLVILWLSGSCFQEPILTDRDTLSVFSYGQNGVSDFRNPVLHELCDVDACGNADAFPEVVRNAVCEQLLLEIKRDTLEEFFFSDVAREHAQN